MQKQQLNLLSIIPARSGSTQVKNKNIKITWVVNLFCTIL